MTLITMASPTGSKSDDSISTRSRSTTSDIEGARPQSDVPNHQLQSTLTAIKSNHMSMLSSRESTSHDYCEGSPLAPAFVVLGGKESAKSRTSNVWAITLGGSSPGKVISLQALARPLFCTAAVTHKNVLYVVGGRAGDGLFGTSLACWSYNPGENKWKELPPLTQVRHGHCAVVIGDDLVALGGREKEGVNSTMEVLKLSPMTKWSNISDMPFQVYDSAVVCLDDVIILAGGFQVGNLPLATGKNRRSIFRKKEQVEGVVPATWTCKWPAQTWKRVADMNHARERHAMVSCRERVYVVGGAIRLGDDWDDLDEGPRQNVNIPEVYNPKTDQWTILAQIPMGQSSMAAAVHDGMVYTVGGYSFYRRSSLNVIQVYNPTTDKWISLSETLPKPVCFHSGVLLNMPLSLIQPQ